MGASAENASTKKSLARVFLHMVRYELTSKQFVISVLLVVFVLVIHKPLVQEATLDTILVPIQWNNASLLIMLAAGFCSASGFSRDVSSGFHYFEIAACGKMRYFIPKFLSCSFTTGVAVLVGILLYGCFVCLFIPGSTYFVEESTLDYGAFNELVLEGNELLVVVFFSYVQFLFGSLIGSVGIAATAFLPNKYIGYVAPFAILFIWSQLAMYLSWPIWINPLQFSKCLYETGGLIPTLVIASVFFLALDALLCLVFVIKAKRVLHNA